MAQNLEPHDLGTMSLVRPSTSASQSGLGDELAWQLPEASSSNPRKVATRVTITEHFTDNRVMPQLGLSGPGNAISRARHHASIPTSTSKSRATPKEGTQ